MNVVKVHRLDFVEILHAGAVGTFVGNTNIDETVRFWTDV
jgi:hypothetical protein